MLAEKLLQRHYNIDGIWCCVNHKKQVLYNLLNIDIRKLRNLRDYLTGAQWCFSSVGKIQLIATHGSSNNASNQMFLSRFVSHKH